MNILITGGAGFIGSQLGFYLLEKGYHVTMVDTLAFSHIDNLINKGKMFPRFVGMDIRDKKFESLLKGVDILFHFAGITSLPECQESVYEGYSTNVAGTAHVLELARRAGVKRVVFSSTSAIYENNSAFPLKESDSTVPTLFYSLAKKQAEEICQSFIKTYGMDICILRFFNVYGPHQDYLRKSPPVVSYIIRCMLENRRPILHSNGKQKRDMIYVSDILKMCEIVMLHKEAKNNIFNVGSGKAYSLQEVVDEIAKQMKKTSVKPIFFDPYNLWKSYRSIYQGKYTISPQILEREVNKYTLASIKKSKKLLGWKAKISLIEGLSLTIKFAKEEYAKKKKI